MTILLIQNMYLFKRNITLVNCTFYFNYLLSDQRDELTLKLANL